MSIVTFPSTLILFVSVHGVIPLTEAREVETFIVPDGMTITRAMATRPGVCNMTTEPQIDKIAKLLMKENLVGSYYEYIQYSASKLKRLNKGVIKEVSEQFKSSESEPESRNLEEQFLRYHIPTPTIKVFNERQIMIDKYLTRSSEEGKDSRFDYKLNIMNIPGYPDLFDIFMFTPEQQIVTRSVAKTTERGVYLSTLAKVLKDQGVKELVLVDFSCSSFDESELPPAEAERLSRLARRHAELEGRGRKQKTRRRKHKTKTRKAKKRRALWSR